MSKVADNVELGFPARMSDGRQFTDYRPNCYLNNELGQNMGSWQYRTFLTRNAVEIHNKMSFFFAIALNGLKKISSKL